MGNHAGRCALIVAIVGSTTAGHAGGVVSNGWGFVPGARIGAVRASFDGTEAMPDAQRGWGYTTEIHVDAQRTFRGDRSALGLSLGIVSQTHGTVDEDGASAPDAFEYDGLSTSLQLTTLVARRAWATARVGLVQGETETAAGPIQGTLKRFGLEVARMWKTDVLHLAAHVGVEYFTGNDGGRGYDALAFVVGGTFVFSNR